MYAVYKLRAEELDQRFLDTLKSQFQNREIEIAVCEVADTAEDETAYLLRSPANRERLLRAIENVDHGRDLKVIDPASFTVAWT
jgi:antitoxin YefM